MSVLPYAKNTWVPSKEFMAAVRDLYWPGRPIDLTKFSAEDWTQAVAYSENADKLLHEGRHGIESWHRVTRPIVSEFIYDLCNAGVEIDLESLCSFGNLSFVIDWKSHDIKELNSAIAFIIENKIWLWKMHWAHISRDVSQKPPYDVDLYKVVGNGEQTRSVCAIKFNDILEPFSNRWFENWRSGDSIDAGALLVSLCDYLKVKVEPIAESPKEWNIEEYQFEEYAQENKESLKKFARLFSKPMNQWYCKDWCS